MSITKDIRANSEKKNRLFEFSRMCRMATSSKMPLMSEQTEFFVLCVFFFSFFRSRLYRTSQAGADQCPRLLSLHLTLVRSRPPQESSPMKQPISERDRKNLMCNISLLSLNERLYGGCTSYSLFTEQNGSDHHSLDPPHAVLNFDAAYTCRGRMAS